MTSGRIVTTPAQLRAAMGGQPVGLVPTMGALHEGHLSLIRQSARDNPLTVVSVFVNPTQFGSATDLAAYPRVLESDAARAFTVGADIIYAPAAEIVYPPGFSTTVTVAALTDRWEGASRPGHFAGVATVVAILLNTVRPARSYFGEKDFQQLAVIRRMHADLLLPGEIIGRPTVRDRDGLALSSRNARLSPDERAAAAAIPQALYTMRDAADAGETDSGRLVARGRMIIDAQPLLTLDYLAIVDEQTLEPLGVLRSGSRALVAVVARDTRLIDNLAIA
ncbi:MAG TPA: pantoate--beta-alanine ligase [Thermomicrobiales bacterium]|nr:pantoate--beta-alanine ligase [Thermomicrobiales bacterium]